MNNLSIKQIKDILEKYPDDFIIEKISFKLDIEYIKNKFTSGEFKPLGWRNKMSFGKYIGKTIQNIYKKDKKYIDNCIEKIGENMFTTNVLSKVIKDKPSEAELDDFVAQWAMDGKSQDQYSFSSRHGICENY